MFCRGEPILADVDRSVNDCSESLDVLSHGRKQGFFIVPTQVHGFFVRGSPLKIAESELVSRSGDDNQPQSSGAIGCTIYGHRVLCAYTLVCFGSQRVERPQKWTFQHELPRRIDHFHVLNHRRLEKNRTCETFTVEIFWDFLSSAMLRMVCSTIQAFSFRSVCHRGMAPSRSRHDAADRVAKAASDGFALVETERSVLAIQSPSLLTRFTSLAALEEPSVSLLLRAFGRSFVAA